MQQWPRSGPRRLRVFVAVAFVLSLVIGSDAAAQLPHGIPNLCTDPTATSVRNGSWSDPATWSIGQVPTVNDRVAIAAGTTVTYDRQSDADLACVNVFGQLTFRSDISTRLTVATMTVMPGGGLQIGTIGSPVAAGVTAELVIADRPFETGVDPEQYGTGLIGLGRVTMHGATKAPTFVRLAAEVNPGQSALSLSAAVSGWQTGDRLVVPGSNQSLSTPGSYQGQWETPTMSSASGTQVALAAGLTYPHGGGRDASGTLAFLPHVGNISRNIIVRSQHPNGTRGHVLLTNRAEVDIRYTAFKDLGRTTIAPLDSTVMSSGHATHIGSNQVGRYSLHLHHLFGPASPAPNSYQYVLIGNAIDGGTRWGITIHNTHYGLVQDNVIYNAAGAGIMTEDGSETANVIQNNFIVRAWGTGHERGDGRQGSNDWGWEGSGIWLRGPDNYVRNNVIANVNSFAVTLMMLGVSSVRVPSAPGADPSVSGHTVNMMTAPLREFSSNEFYGAHRGITVWNLGANCCTNVYDVPVSTFHNTRMWNVGVLGFYGYGENRVTFDGWVHYNDPSTLSNPNELNTSFYFGDYIARNIVIRHADIQGLRIGVTAPTKAGDTRDIYGGTPGTLLIENSTLKNYWNIYTNTPYGATGGGSMIPPRVVIARNVQFSNVAGTSTTRPQAHVFRHFTPAQGTNPNVTVQDRVVVESFNGNPNDNFEVFSPEQAPTFVIPSNPLTSHVAGLTNAQAWAASRVAISGAVAPCATTRAGIVGFICPTGPLPALPAAPTSPTPTPTPTASTSPAPSPAPAPHTCTIPDPFVSLGGGTCVNGNWLPQALAPAPAAALSVRPARGAGTSMPVSPVSPSMGSPAPAPKPISPPTSGSRACSSSDPFVSMGGGTCSNGNWYPPSAPPPPPPTPPMTGGCANPDPFVSLGGGTCSNGNWNPPSLSSTASAPAPGGAPAPIPATAGCAGNDPYARLPNVIGSCVSGSWIPVPREAGVSSASASIPPPLPPPPVGITLNPAVKFQTINGWEASLPSSLISASAMTEAQWSLLLDLAVNEMGVNRLRLDVAAGTEGRNGTDYAIVNDNADPNVIDPAGFNWTTLDQRIERVILPWRQRVLARQETPYINLQYVDKADSSFEHYANPQEYAEFMVAVFEHLRTKYGFVPDAIEVIHQPNEVNGWRTAANIANVILATAARLQAAGFGVPDFIGPSTSTAGAASTFIDRINAVPAAMALVKEIGYHRSGGTTALPNDISNIASRGTQLGKRTAMLEYRADPAAPTSSPNYAMLHEDLSVGRSSVWQQGVLADKSSCVGQWTRLNNGIAELCPTSKLTRQYTKYVRPGASRIQATGNTSFEPLAFVNADGRHVVVVKAATGGAISISGLPAGVYGVYSTESGGANVTTNWSNVTVAPGQPLSARIPSAGVITVYKR
jgi:hypothetical protein